MLQRESRSGIVASMMLSEPRPLGDYASIDQHQLVKCVYRP